MHQSARTIPNTIDTWISLERCWPRGIVSKTLSRQHLYKRATYGRERETRHQTVRPEKVGSHIFLNVPLRKLTESKGHESLGYHRNTMVSNVNFLLLFLYQTRYPCQCHSWCAELQCSTLLIRPLCLGRPPARSLASQPVSCSWPFQEVSLSLFVRALKFL
jgi:hypothetical protein